VFRQFLGQVPIETGCLIVGGWTQGKSQKGNGEKNPDRFSWDGSGLGFGFEEEMQRLIDRADEFGRWASRGC